MLKLVHAVLLGLLGAGIVHIGILLLVPRFSQHDAWSRLATGSGLYKIVRLDPETGGPPVVKSVDPMFLAAACRFELDDGMVKISASGSVPFWSVSVYDRNGHNLHSFNDRNAADGSLNALVLTPAQMIEVRKELPEELEGSVFVEAPVDEGIAVIRAFVPDESWKPKVSRFLERTSCASRRF